jgi:hypothetical protein
MQLDIEKDYSEFLAAAWQRLSDLTTNIDQPQDLNDQLDDLVAQSSIQFLHDQLETLENDTLLDTLLT